MELLQRARPRFEEGLHFRIARCVLGCVRARYDWIVDMIIESTSSSLVELNQNRDYEPPGCLTSLWGVVAI